MEKEKIIGAVVGGIVAGFSIGVGFLLAQRTMGRLASKKAKGGADDVASAVKQGVAEGVKQAKVEQDAASYANMTASRGAKAKRMVRQQPSPFMGFNGDASKMEFNGDPIHFGAMPNADLHRF